MTISKAEKLSLIAEKIAVCEKCTELCNHRIANEFKTVPGHGNAESKVVFVGEAAGQNEGLTGLPFVGRAGQLLDKLLLEAGIKREDVFVLNILKCKPPQNRTPTPQEAENCRPYLDIQLQVIQPKYLVCLGATASTHILGAKCSMGSLRGKWHDKNIAGMDLKVLCTWHPSYLLRPNGFSHRSETVDDFKSLLAELHNED